MHLLRDAFRDRIRQGLLDSDHVTVSRLAGGSATGSTT